jgi:hypothetical protein
MNYLPQRYTRPLAADQSTSEYTASDKTTWTNTVLGHRPIHPELHGHRSETNKYQYYPTTTKGK